MTGRCYTAREAQKAAWEAKWAAQERAWEVDAAIRAKAFERNRARAREQERIAGQAAGAEMRVELRQREIRRRVQELEARAEGEKKVARAQELLRRLSALGARTPDEARERMMLERDYQKVEEGMRKAAEEAFYRKRPRMTLNGIFER